MGLPEPDFWSMTHAQFLRVERAWLDRREAQFFDTVNAMGLVWHGKDWKWQKPGGGGRDENFERMKAGLAQLEERRKEKHG